MKTTLLWFYFITGFWLSIHLYLYIDSPFSQALFQTQPTLINLYACVCAFITGKGYDFYTQSTFKHIYEFEKLH